MDYVFLDKTGTLTEGKFTVTGVEVLTDMDRKKNMAGYKKTSLRSLRTIVIEALISMLAVYKYNIKL